MLLELARWLHEMGMMPPLFGYITFRAILGALTALLHADIGAQAQRAGIARLWTVGELSAEASRAFGDGARHFNDQPALVAALASALQAAPAGLRCLVKGSRSSAMDQVVAAVLAADRQGDADHAA